MSWDCNHLFEIISYMLIILSFFIGVFFFSKSKQTASRKSTGDKESEIQMEKSFFIDNAE